MSKIMDPDAVAVAEDAMLLCGLAPFTYAIDAPDGMLYAYGRIPEGRPQYEPLTKARERLWTNEAISRSKDLS